MFVEMVFFCRLMKMMRSIISTMADRNDAVYMVVQQWVSHRNRQVAKHIQYTHDQSDSSDYTLFIFCSTRNHFRLINFYKGNKNNQTVKTIRMKIIEFCPTNKNATIYFC